MKAYFCNLYYKKIGVLNRRLQGHVPLPSPVSPFPSHHTSFSRPRITYQTRKEHFTAEKGSKRSQHSTYCLLKEFHLQSLERCPHRGSAPWCWLLTTSSALATEQSNPTGISWAPALCQALFWGLDWKTKENRKDPYPQRTNIWLGR